MSTLKTIATLAAPALLLAGCGGDDEKKATTVVKTIVQTQAAPSLPTTPATSADPTATTATAPADQPKPVANLPESTPAVSGEFEMKILSKETDLYIGSDEDEGDQRKWFATMNCDGSSCTVDLRRELPQGGFKTLTLRQDGDARRYAAMSVGGADACDLSKPAGGPRQRLSIRVTGTEDVGGQETATRIDGYLTVRQDCKDSNGDVNRPRAVVQYRGRRPYQGSEEQQVP